MANLHGVGARFDLPNPFDTLPVMIFDQAAYSDGSQAYLDGAGPEDCPHEVGSDAGKSWLKGHWQTANDPYHIYHERGNP